MRERLLTKGACCSHIALVESGSRGLECRDFSQKMERGFWFLCPLRRESLFFSPMRSYPGISGIVRPTFGDFWRRDPELARGLGEA
jgi:hypothetical protein